MSDHDRAGDERDESAKGPHRGFGCDYHASRRPSTTLRFIMLAMNYIPRHWLGVLFLTLAVQVPSAQAPQGVALADVQALKCSFTLMATGNWEKAGPTAEVTKATLSMGFDSIDTQDGTANAVNVSSSSAGAPHITVRLLADSLHFMAMNTSGSVYLTTVFADKESRSGANFKAVHTRHEFTPVRLTGWTSRPEQYYGYCEVVK
jgi:hypothetical protein